MLHSRGNASVKVIIALISHTRFSFLACYVTSRTRVFIRKRKISMQIRKSDHIALLVKDVERLHAHDVQIRGGPRPRGDGVQQMYICDPDGYIVEFFVWDV